MFKSSYTVEVGYNSPHRDKQTKVKATKVDIHPRYIIDNKTDDKYDIAVLTFPTITFGAGVQQIPVDSGQLEPHQPLLAVGWGTTEEGNGMTNSLKRANIKVGEPSACKGAIGGFDDSNEQQVCAQKSLTPGKNICSGDSGSGVFINRNGKQYLLGIASLGINGGGETCDGANAISVFVHVISHLDFVVESSALTREYLLDKKANDKGDDQSQPGNKCDDSPPPAN
ncbi:hypothetical protein H4R21_003975 [Coemansia helicoidea]|uniref:Uncharacterized protein n=1 Tax=Coemansia helicoidea TaxID=1286919 RepID=A0ACC1L0R3_9FUNG|nr:hypothetical protein H4R21_003975 [Coemansia helicoidea]